MEWRYRNTALTLCMFAFFVTMVARLAISPVAPFIIDEFNVSTSLIGVALTGMWLAYALMQFPSGILGEYYGEKPVILLSVGGVVLLSVLLLLSPVFAVFALCCLLLGGFAGLHYSPATTFLTRSFDNAGTVIGIHGFGAPMAGLVTPVVVSWLGVRYGWQVALAFIFAVGVPVFVAFYFGVRPTEPTNSTQSLGEQVDIDLLRELLTRPAIGFSICIAFIGEFLNQGLLSFLPTFLIQYQGYSPTRAGFAFSAFFLVVAVGSVSAGAISDRYGRDRTIATCLVLAAIGILLALIGSDTVALLGVGILAIGTCNVIVVQPRVLDQLSAEERGTGFGLVRTVYMILGSLGSVTVGSLADAFGWAISFGFLALLCLFVAGGIIANGWLNLEY